MAPSYYGHPADQQQPEYMGGPGPVYGQPPQPVYGGGPAAGQHPVDALSGQFGGMGLGGGMPGQKLFTLQTTNLLTSPPEPRELHRPPPEIRLPPNSCLSPSPSANADPSYQRCTLNAIPTTASLLAKAKIPLAIVLAPYRSLKDGDEAVPVVGDTVIARCRRCRTYINPYVQFIDGGNR
jgi:protein transport protein SEC24